MTATSALIPAAGVGNRLGLGPKALLRLGDRTLLELLIETLRGLTDEILVAAPPGHEDEFEAVLGETTSLITGGPSRQDSIDRLVGASHGEVLLIQDAARPFCSRALTEAVLAAAQAEGAAGAFLDPTVPVGRLENGAVERYWSRQQAGIFQAPQAFKRDILLTAREQMRRQEFQSTAQMVLDAGFSLAAVAGEAENIKITTALDWEIARRVIAPKLGLTN